MGEGGKEEEEDREITRRATGRCVPCALSDQFMELKYREH